MKISAFLVLFFFFVKVGAQDFSATCESQWHQETLAPEFLRLLESPEIIDHRMAQEILLQRNLNEVEMRLLEKVLANKIATHQAANELRTLMSLQVPCPHATITVSGIPLRQTDYLSVPFQGKKHFSYFEVSREVEAPPINSSYDTLHSDSWNRWKWVAVAAAVVAGVYFQQNYQIEY